MEEEATGAGEQRNEGGEEKSQDTTKTTSPSFPDPTRYGTRAALSRVRQERRALYPLWTMHHPTPHTGTSPGRRRRRRRMQRLRESQKGERERLANTRTWLLHASSRSQPVVFSLLGQGVVWDDGWDGIGTDIIIIISTMSLLLIAIAGVAPGTGQWTRRIHPQPNPIPFPIPLP